MTSSADSLAMPESPQNPDSPDLDGTVSWRALLTETEILLERSGKSDNPGREARWIMEEVTGTTGAEFAEALDGLATTRGVAHLDALVARRSGGEPIQYVLGHWAFRSIDVLVDRRVLIPRPETEIVAGLALDELDRLCPNGEGTAVDLGTGSGVIGLSIAVERPNSRVLMTDKSRDALAVARANLAGIGLAARGVEIAEGSWFQAVPDRYKEQCDVIVSNPPYVAPDDVLDDSVADWEPESALRATERGLHDLLHIVDRAGGWLRPRGALVLELGATQAGEIVAHGERNGYQCSVHQDLAGLDRAVILRVG